MFKFIDSGLYNAQFVRTLGSVGYQAAEISECLTVLDNLVINNNNSWYECWSSQGDKNLAHAKEASNKNLNLTAYFNFLRASTYYRTSYFFLENRPEDKRIEEALDKSIDAFEHAIKLMPYEVKIVNIPFKGIQLKAYLYLSSDQKSPLIINCAGGDGTKEEAFSCASEALSHNYHCISFEGPGQGSVLRKQKIPFMPNWEEVVAAVIDFVIQYPQIDSDNLIYYGKSFGGFLGARAITAEKRIKACVLDPGQFDAAANLKMIAKNSKHNQNISSYIQELIDKDPNSDFAFIINSRLWRYGVDSIEAFVNVMKSYTLEGLVQNISCHTLILDNEEEYLSLGQAKLLYDKLNCPKNYHLFKASENTGGHCQPFSAKITFAYIFDWLEAVLQKPKI